MIRLYAVILLAGGLVVSIGCLSRSDPRPGFYPFLAVMLLALPALPRATTSLEFIFVWELITLSSYFLILQRRQAAPHALRYPPVLARRRVLPARRICDDARRRTAASRCRRSAPAGPDVAPVFVLLAIGLLIKAGAVGVHVWLPDTYAEADDDVSALLSAVISKVAIFGLFVGTYVAIRSDAGLNLAHVLGWIGMLTTLVGALLAVRQDDIKRMLAYSSMSQLGYIVAAIALMSHLGWVTALYLVANHLLVKGILFLAAAAIILRTGTRLLSDLGGLARVMPQTFALAAIAIVAMSGLPPLAGFGGKWLLLSAMMEKGWYMPAADDAARDLRRLSLYGALHPGDFPRRAEASVRGHERGADCAPDPAISAGGRHSGDVVLPEAADRSGLAGDRPAIRRDAALGGHVARADLRVLESGAGDGCRGGDRGGPVRDIVAAASRPIRRSARIIDGHLRLRPKHLHRPHAAPRHTILG